MSNIRKVVFLVAVAIALALVGTQPVQASCNMGCWYRVGVGYICDGSAETDWCTVDADSCIDGDGGCVGGGGGGGPKHPNPS